MPCDRQHAYEQVDMPLLDGLGLAESVLIAPPEPGMHSHDGTPTVIHKKNSNLDFCRRCRLNAFVMSQVAVVSSHKHYWAQCSWKSFPWQDQRDDSPPPGENAPPGDVSSVGTSMISTM